MSENTQQNSRQNPFIKLYQRCNQANYSNRGWNQNRWEDRRYNKFTKFRDNHQNSDRRWRPRHVLGRRRCGKDNQKNKNNNSGYRENTRQINNKSRIAETFDNTPDSSIAPVSFTFNQNNRNNYSVDRENKTSLNNINNTPDNSIAPVSSTTKDTNDNNFNMINIKKENNNDTTKKSSTK